MTHGPVSRDRLGLRTHVAVVATRRSRRKEVAIGADGEGGHCSFVTDEAVGDLLRGNVPHLWWHGGGEGEFVLRRVADEVHETSRCTLRVKKLRNVPHGAYASSAIFVCYFLFRVDMDSR